MEGSGKPFNLSLDKSGLPGIIGGLVTEEVMKMIVRVLEYQKIGKGNLLGKADLLLEGVGLELRGCSHIEGKTGAFIGLPSREYKDEDTGERRWFQVVRFPDSEDYYEFQRVSVAAIEKHNAGDMQAAQSEPFAQDSVDDVPF